MSKCCRHGVDRDLECFDCEDEYEAKRKADLLRSKRKADLLRSGDTPDCVRWAAQDVADITRALIEKEST